MTDHHDGCFGCGQANLFGLQLEDGRFFVKQDHQGERGFAHRGIIAAALLEACDAERLEIEFHAPVPIGVFVDVGASGGRAEARVDGTLVASARVPAPR
ncbi:MAG TPA: hypothetical protein VHF45_01685 [Thermoleophilaceae bacterium]|nr:hypothetical protein [Thermoleophilaceae bacterium]